MTFNPIKPDLSNYVGDYNMIAGINGTGSDASEFNEEHLASYKYIKITPVNNTPGEIDPGENNNEISNNNELGAGAIVGIVLASVVVAGIGGFALVWFVIKKKSWADFIAIFKKK